MWIRLASAHVKLSAVRSGDGCNAMHISSSGLRASKSHTSVGTGGHWAEAYDDSLSRTRRHQSQPLILVAAMILEFLYHSVTHPLTRNQGNRCRISNYDGTKLIAGPDLEQRLL